MIELFNRTTYRRWLWWDHRWFGYIRKSDVPETIWIIGITTTSAEHKTAGFLRGQNQPCDHTEQHRLKQNQTYDYLAAMQYIFVFVLFVCWFIVYLLVLLLLLLFLLLLLLLLLLFETNCVHFKSFKWLFIESL